MISRMLWVQSAFNFFFNAMKLNLVVRFQAMANCNGNTTYKSVFDSGLKVGKSDTPLTIWVSLELRTGYPSLLVTSSVSYVSVL